MCWTSDLAAIHAEALWLTAARPEAWILISERAFLASSPADREDTVRHEIAHVVAWARHGTRIRAHGREWLSARRDLDLALDVDEDS